MYLIWKAYYGPVIAMQSSAWRFSLVFSARRRVWPIGLAPRLSLAIHNMQHLHNVSLKDYWIGGLNTHVNNCKPIT